MLEIFFFLREQDYILRERHSILFPQDVILFPQEKIFLACHLWASVSSCSVHCFNGYHRAIGCLLDPENATNVVVVLVV